MVHFKLLRNSFLISFFLLGCSQPEKKCVEFRTGSFEFKTKIDNKEYISKFIRTDSTEVEIFNGIRDTSSVRWVSGCEFILKNINPKKSRTSISMKILSTSEKSYVFEYSIIGDDRNKKRGTAIQLN